MFFLCELRKNLTSFATSATSDHIETVFKLNAFALHHPLALLRMVLLAWDCSRKGGQKGPLLLYLKYITFLLTWWNVVQLHLSWKKSKNYKIMLDTTWFLPPVPKIRYVILAMIKLSTVISYLANENPKISKAPETSPEFCWHQHFSLKISSFCYVVK